MSAGHIPAPDGFLASGFSAAGADSENGDGYGLGKDSKLGPGRRISASRPTRVVGVLDHPVTPMPPVSCAGFLRPRELTTNSFTVVDSGKQ